YKTFVVSAYSGSTLNYSENKCDENNLKNFRNYVKKFRKRNKKQKRIHRMLVCNKLPVDHSFKISQ
ncbi:hypothetical protein L9F63_002389, partial [Diploptera punctata]